MRRLQAVRQNFSSFSTEIAGLMAEGDLVAVRLTHRTRTRAHLFRCRSIEVAVRAERNLDWSAIVQFRLRDGKIAEEWVMRDELAMLAQLGKVTVCPEST